MSYFRGKLSTSVANFLREEFLLILFGFFSLDFPENQTLNLPFNTEFHRSIRTTTDKGTQLERKKN